jgi:membrane protease YdiL (CAAX protease family)
VEETTAVVYAGDDEDDILSVKDLLEREGIACSLIMRSENYLYGPGILNEGMPLLAGKYVIRVPVEDEQRSLELIEHLQTPAMGEASDSTHITLRPSTEMLSASSAAETVPVARPARLVESIVFAAIFPAAAFAIIWALYLLGFSFRLRATVDIFVRIAAFMIVAAVIKSRLHRPALEMASLVPGPPATYVLTLAGYIGIFLLLSPVDRFLAQAFPFYERSIQVAQRLYVSSDVVGTLLRSSFVTPVLEETLFRGVIFAGLARNYRLPTALVASSLIFALYHHNPAQFIGPLLGGLLFAAAYHRSSSLIPCFLGHGLNNFVWFVESFYRSFSHSERGLFEVDSSLDVPRVIVGTLVLALSVAVLLGTRSNKNHGPGGDKSLDKVGTSAIWPPI